MRGVGCAVGGVGCAVCVCVCSERGGVCSVCVYVQWEGWSVEEGGVESTGDRQIKAPAILCEKEAKKRW